MLVHFFCLSHLLGSFFPLLFSPSKLSGSPAQYLLSSKRLSVSNKLVNIVEQRAAEAVRPSDKHLSCHCCSNLLLCGQEKSAGLLDVEPGGAVYFNLTVSGTKVHRCLNYASFFSILQPSFVHTLQFTNSVCVFFCFHVTLLESNVFLPLHIFKQAMSPRCMIHWWAVSCEENQSLGKKKKILEFLWSFQHHVCCVFKTQEENCGTVSTCCADVLKHALLEADNCIMRLVTLAFLFLLIFPPAHALCTTPVIKTQAIRSKSCISRDFILMLSFSCLLCTAQWLIWSLGEEKWQICLDRRAKQEWQKMHVRASSHFLTLK